MDKAREMVDKTEALCTIITTNLLHYLDEHLKAFDLPLLDPQTCSIPHDPVSLREMFNDLKQDAQANVEASEARLESMQSEYEELQKKYRDSELKLERLKQKSSQMDKEMVSVNNELIDIAKASEDLELKTQAVLACKLLTNTHFVYEGDQNRVSGYCANPHTRKIVPIDFDHTQMTEEQVQAKMWDIVNDNR